MHVAERANSFILNIESGEDREALFATERYARGFLPNRLAQPAEKSIVNLYCTCYSKSNKTRFGCCIPKKESDTMSYVYDQRKRPQGQQNTEPERTAAPGLSMDALMNGAARPAAQKRRSFDLDAAMKARMTSTFGDLSAVRNYTHPAQTKEPADTGPYTGPVTHAVSGASPSPAAAGPMQAKKSYRESKDSDRDYINDEAQFVKPGAANYKTLDPKKWTTVTRTPTGFFSFLRPTKRFKAKIDRRPWEMTREELQNNRFNPNNVSDLTDIQDKISTAGANITAKPKKGFSQKEAQNGFNNRAAWQTFQEYSGAGEMDSLAFKGKGKKEKNWDMLEVDHTAFTNKLKNMSRMVRDYPELKNHIGSLRRETNEQSKKRKERFKAIRALPTFMDEMGNVRDKKLRERRKRQKGTGPAPVKLQPAPMGEYQPNLSWQQDDIVDPGWVEGPKKEKDKSGTMIMATGHNTSYSPDNGYDLRLNAEVEGSSNEARKDRQEINENATKKYGTTLDYAANHELGHMLNFDLVKELYRKKSDKRQIDPKTGKEIAGTSEREKANQHDMLYNITAARLVEQALKETMPKEEFAKLVRYEEDSLGLDEMWDPKVQLGENEEWVTEDTDQFFLNNQINLKASGLGATEGNRGYTTKYGATNASEFFAEAFADVYQNGADARPTSIRLVQLYEEEMKKAKAANEKE